MTGFQNIRTTTDNRDSLMRLKLNIAAELGHDISMGDMVGFLIILGNAHITELTRIAREST